MTVAPIDLLLVDDEPRNLDTLEAILAGPEYRLLRAQDADTALRLLLEHDVAAIVLDIHMPGVSGFELAEMIKKTKRFRETPILFLTAYMLDDQHVIQGYGAGAVDYLTKPLNPKILRHKIAVFAELFRKTRALAELNERLEDRVKERTAELERSRAALLEAAKQKDEFLAVLAHELRNPLAPMRTGVDLLLRQQSLAPSAARTLGIMNRQLDHIVRLVDDLMDVSRITRGALELKRQTIEVTSVLQTAVESSRAFFEQRKQTIEVNAADGVAVDGDPVRVGQIIGNLLHNASKFTPAGGVVRVETASHDGRVAIRVIDSGIGIKPEHLDRVFGMFARLQRSDLPMQAGLGIGLALSRRLAEMHGGTLTVQSAGENLGSVFTLTLPVATAKPRAAATETPVQDGPAVPRSVVVIEDNADVADTLMEWLRVAGHHAAIARSGAAGLALVRDTRPEVVLCDLGMPGMDGLDVCRKVRELALAKQPVMIALTGWGREDDRAKTVQAGFDHHLVKPVSLRELDVLLRTTATR